MNVRIRKGGPLAALALFTALGVLVGAGALVWTRTEITRHRYELMRLHKAESRMRGQVEKLRIESAALAAPERIERRARRLGLRYPRAGEVTAIRLSEPRELLAADASR